ncbi:MAG: hypothetical protein ACI9LE_001482 [Paraglaciecola sp.]|jgi:hypothetical protein
MLSFLCVAKALFFLGGAKDLLLNCYLLALITQWPAQKGWMLTASPCWISSEYCSNTI